jgi:DNA-binding SARP family transcriptional activator/class 3 adenylate cyclase
MDFRLLGPLEVCDGQGERLPLGGAKQRAVLTILLLHANQVVPTDRLIDEIWDEEPPETAINVLQVYIGQLRKALQPDRTPGNPSQLIVTRPGGYLIQVGPDELDIDRARKLTEQARAALLTEPGAAVEFLREALGLWRGQPLADVGFASAQGETARLEELRFTALESRLEADLARGKHAEVVGELEALASHHPLRESLRAHLMLALYRSGRQAEALAVFRETKRLLSEELGIDPSPQLASLELAILRHDPRIASPTIEVRVSMPSTTESRPVASCPRCGGKSDPGEELCARCAAMPVSGDERKVVSVLVAALIRTATGDGQRDLDPEDLHQLSAPLVDRFKAEVEGYGGRVEQSIGSAVMALFGVPVSHEDDPERAVRAALAVRDWVREHGEFQFRAAVNSGAVLVTIGTTSTEGRAFASGDVIDATARLESVAPVNEIVVGEKTYRATSHVIAYRASPATLARGDSILLPALAWEAIEARSRLGVDLARVSRAPLAGRLREVNALKDALERVRNDHSTQLVTLAGVPGIGKSRLVAELFQVADEDTSELIAWRQGRSLPYGEGITFWALAEIVKAHAGILETDTPDQAEEKLGASVRVLMADSTDARWIEGHLRPLAGLNSGAQGGDDRREEAFAAWRRFLEAIAEQGPLVLVFEDLHWADDNLLDFVEHLVGWANGVPILVVCTARPELFERRAGWGGGIRNSTTLWLNPLSNAETAQLISRLSDRPIMAAATQQALLERAGGNPLYAEQYVRVLEERGDAEELALPETVQGIIAARLDALAAEEKRLLQSAAVIGKVFWLGSLAQVGGFDRRVAETYLHALERKDFVQRARRSSVANEAEYAFLHVLVRDVAYGQIPRGQRGEQHRLAAEWIAALGRAEDHAEMLAYHYRNTIELRRAVGQVIEAKLAGQAMVSIREAGDRAFSLNAFQAGASLYHAALELASGGSPEHAELMFKFGLARQLAGDLDPDTFMAASEELVACGDFETAAEAEGRVAIVISESGDRDAALSHLNRARQLVDGRPPSRAKTSIACTATGFLMMAGESQEAIRLGHEAVAMAEALGLNDLRATALNMIGAARSDAGDPRGMEDLETSLTVAIEANAPMQIFLAKANTSGLLWEWGQLTRSYALCEEAEEIGRRFGLISFLRWQRGEAVGYQFGLGRWKEALIGAEQFLGEVETGSPHYMATSCYRTRAQIRLAEDNIPGAVSDVEKALDLARTTKDPQSLFPTLAESAYIYCECGDLERASALADEFFAVLKADGIGYGIVCVHLLAWTLRVLERDHQILNTFAHSKVPWAQAALSFASGDLVQAANLCGAIGAATEEARDRLWSARDLIKQGRRSDADVQLQQALAFYRSVGATRYIRDADMLLASCA